MLDRIENLTIEVIDDADGRLIMLEQDSCGNISSVAIHPVHVRHLAEKLGLTHLADPTAQRTIASLTRRIRVLADRIESLHDFLINHSDTKHADLTWEQTYSKATLDSADEFIAELDDAEANTVATIDRTLTDKQSVTPSVTQCHDVSRLVTKRTSQQQPLL